MRAAPLLLAVALVAGCAGAVSTEKVLVRNHTDGGATITVEALDTVTGETAFTHGFQVVQPGQALTVDADFRSGREYRVNASAFYAEQSQRWTEQTVAIPEGGQLEVTLAREGTLGIVVLAIQ